MNRVCTGLLTVSLILAASVSSLAQDREKDGDRGESTTAVEDSSAGANELWREDAEAKKYPDPNEKIARSSRSVIYHFFALPSKIWKIVTTPLAVFLTWADQVHLLQK